MQPQKLSEDQINQFLQKVSKKAESAKTTAETQVDDLVNHFVNLTQRLWKELTETKKELESLKKQKPEEQKEQKGEKESSE